MKHHIEEVVRVTFCCQHLPETELFNALKHLDPHLQTNPCTPSGAAGMLTVTKTEAQNVVKLLARLDVPRESA